MKTIGFIDYFLDEWHASNFPTWLHDISGGEMGVKYAWAKIDSPRPNGLTNAEWSERHNIQLCQTEEEVIEKSDYLVVLSPDNPEMHMELCRKSLSSGKHVYVDKTFSPDKKTAVALFELAEKHNTATYSCSSLRYATEYTSLSRSGISGVSSYGGGDIINYLVHQIEPVVMLMGTDAIRVKCTGTESLPVFAIDYGDSRIAHVSCFKNAPFVMYVRYNDGRDSHLTIQSEYFKGFAKDMVDFFNSGIPPVSSNETIAIMSIRESCLESLSHFDSWITIN